MSWKKKFSSVSGNPGNDQADEIRQLKKELARVTDERDILKKTIPGFGPPVRGRNRLCHAGRRRGVPTAYWRRSIPFQNVAHGLLRT